MIRRENLHSSFMRTSAASVENVMVITLNVTLAIRTIESTGGIYQHLVNLLINSILILHTTSM